jgi:hypothetical protein
VEEMEVQRRIPRSMGVFSSSTYLVDRRAGGTAVGSVQMYGQHATATPATLMVLDKRWNVPRGEASRDCNWPDEAREAAFFAVENGAHFERDGGGQPLALNGAGPWTLGGPSYGQPGSTELDSEVLSRPDHCSGVQAQTRVSQRADRRLPAQTHTFLSPEPADAAQVVAQRA